MVEGTGLENRPSVLASQNRQQNLRLLAARRRPNWPIQASSGHKNVYSVLPVAMQTRLVANYVADGTSPSQRFLITQSRRFKSFPRNHEARKDQKIAAGIVRRRFWCRFRIGECCICAA